MGNQLTGEETERLALLLEEAAEVIHIAGKILRHGYDSTHPDDFIINKRLLEKEIGHFEYAKELMIKCRDISGHQIEGFMLGKEHKVKPYLHYIHE